MKKRERIRQAVSEILGNNPKIPINLTEIAEKLGIEIYTVIREKDYSGSIEKNGGIYEILVNKSHSFKRQRFTIAHEIGHFILHKDDIDRRSEIVDFESYAISRGIGRAYNNSLEPYKEYEANLFASELLMPEQSIEDELFTLIQTIKSLSFENAVDILSEKFEVSTQAMTIRLNNYLTEEETVNC